jgi:DNA repair exonuclease SbcCD ATPase subunit
MASISEEQIEEKTNEPNVEETTTETPFEAVPDFEYDPSAHLKNLNAQNITEVKYEVVEETSDLTEEICTCCPVSPAFVNDDSSKVEEIKKQLKADLSKLEENFTSKKEELQTKIKQLNEEGEPIKEKLREVRKANRDKETELNIEELSEKSLLLRKSFKELIDKVTELSDSRLDAKREFNEYKTACKNKKGDEDYDEDECREALTEKLEAVEKFNAEISSALEQMIKNHDEVVATENQVKVAEDELWTVIFENREKIKDEIVKMDEIYGQASSLRFELENLGEEYENDQRSLNRKARADLKQFEPESTYSWIPWGCRKTDMPKTALVGGYDVDMAHLYVIRREKEDSYEYGKFAAKRGNAYITKRYSEYGVHDFDVSIN